MSDEKKNASRLEDEELERDIRLGRKFSLAEAIGRMGGGDLMKGASPVSRKRQAELVIERYLEGHVVDPERVLRIVLLRRVRESEILLQMRYDRPLTALARYGEQILSCDESLHDFVNEVDAAWGRMYDERPYFQKPGHPPHPDDPYTFASVRVTLSGLIENLQGE